MHTHFDFLSSIPAACSLSLFLLNVIVCAYTTNTITSLMAYAVSIALKAVLHTARVIISNLSSVTQTQPTFLIISKSLRPDDVPNTSVHENQRRIQLLPRISRHFRRYDRQTPTEF
ncbi:hypothetical protein BJ878DRAFT_31327 [Calycina marina]|uniref:Uncharacterized protein n=1 Tax=Calycina marina TaxID=1763456 RepID=A0A9P8CFJ4_9HELO|nr:hypothetical protein BJ878DRAFT_31327 [Calycina marina]